MNILPSAGSCYAVKGHKQQGFAGRNADLLYWVVSGACLLWTDVNRLAQQTQSSNGALRNRETRHLALQFSFDFVFDKLQTEIDHSNFSRLAFKWTELCVVHIHTEKYYSLTDGGNK